MIVRFLGSGDIVGSGGRFQACISVQTAASHILLDCGTSSLIAMRRLELDPGTVDTIVLTHLHGDHFGGIPFFVLDAQFSRRNRPLTVAGPPGTEARVRAAEVEEMIAARGDRHCAVGFKKAYMCGLGHMMLALAHSRYCWRSPFEGCTDFVNGQR